MNNESRRDEKKEHAGEQPWHGQEVQRPQPGRHPEDEASRAEGNGPVRVDRLDAQREPAEPSSPPRRPHDDDEESARLKQESAKEDHDAAERPPRDKTL